MKVLSLVLALLTAGLWGCSLSRPLSDSEFRGFCYTSIGRKASCDTLTICNTFDDDVLSNKYATREQCAAACSNVYNQLWEPNQSDGCGSTVLMAYNWCQKYCTTNYPR